MVPVDADFRADVAATAAAIDDTTVLVVGSAPSYAHGVVDPIPELAALAAARGIRCHVDACIGGWVLPYAARLGRAVPPWTFAVPGRHVDLGRHPQVRLRPEGHVGALHRTPELRRPQFFAYADWPGYTMLNATMQSTKSGGPLAGAWAVVQHLGFAATSPGRCGLRGGGPDRGRCAVGLSVVVPPDSTLVALACDSSCDAFTVCDEMKERGWYVQPQMSYAGAPPTIHLSVRGDLASVDELLADLASSVAAARAAGPVSVDPEVVAFIEALDPSALSDEDFDGLLAARAPAPA